MSKLPVLMYHSVSKTRSSGLTISIEKLEDQFAYLAKNGYRSYHLKELMGVTELPEEPSVVITFDDAYVNQMEHAYPLLKKYQLKATFFVPLAYLGKSDTWNDGAKPIMTAAQLKDLDPTIVELGYHSFAHKMYNRMSLPEIEEDTRLCFECASEHQLGLTATVAYPYGKYPRDEKGKTKFFSHLKEKGFQYGFRIGNRVNTFPFKNPYEIQRIDVKGEYDMKTFRRKLKKGKSWF